MPFRLRALSFNLWCVPLVAKSTEERLDAFLAHVTTDDNYDLLALQECFTAAAQARLRSALPQAGFRYLCFFTSGSDLPGGASGSGLAIASRYPILEQAFCPFSACGRPYAINEWDWQAGKGIGLARIHLGEEWGTADVYVSHLVAQYADGEADTYSSQRVLQALEAAVFIRTTRRSDLTLLLADLNAGPDSLPYRLITTTCGLKDAYSCTHTPEEELLYGGTLTATRALATRARAGAGQPPSRGVTRRINDPTFGVAANAFSAPTAALNNSGRAWGILLAALGLTSSGTPACDTNARLDYILVGTGLVYGGLGSWPFVGPGGAAAVVNGRAVTRVWHVVKSDIRCSEPIALPSGGKANMSDHSAVYAELACVLIPQPAMAVGGHLQGGAGVAQGPPALGLPPLAPLSPSSGAAAAASRASSRASQDAAAGGSGDSRGSCGIAGAGAGRLVGGSSISGGIANGAPKIRVPTSTTPQQSPTTSTPRPVLHSINGSADGRLAAAAGAGAGAGVGANGTSRPPSPEAACRPRAATDPQPDGSEQTPEQPVPGASGQLRSAARGVLDVSEGTLSLPARPRLPSAGHITTPFLGPAPVGQAAALSQREQMRLFLQALAAAGLSLDRVAGLDADALLMGAAAAVATPAGAVGGSAGPTPTRGLSRTPSGLFSLDAASDRLQDGLQGAVGGQPSFADTAAPAGSSGGSSGRGPGLLRGHGRRRSASFNTLRSAAELLAAGTSLPRESSSLLDSARKSGKAAGVMPPHAPSLSQAARALVAYLPLLSALPGWGALLEEPGGAAAANAAFVQDGMVDIVSPGDAVPTSAVRAAAAELQVAAARERSERAPPPSEVDVDSTPVATDDGASSIACGTAAAAPDCTTEAGAEGGAAAAAGGSAPVTPPRVKVAEPHRGPRGKTAASAWRQVLKDTVMAVDRGLRRTELQRQAQQSSAGLLVLGACLCFAAPLALHSPAASVVSGALFAAVALAGVGIWFCGILLRAKLLSTVVALTTTLCAVAVPLGLSLLWHGGLAAGLFALGIVALLGAFATAVLSVTITAMEVRSYRRGAEQLRILLQRPPATIA